MKVLMVSTDAKILEKASEVRARMIWYASVLDSLDILLITRSAAGGEIKVSDRVTVYPRRYWQGFGFKVPAGVEIISTQDPFENGLIGWRLAKKFKLPLQLQVHTDLLSPYFKQESLKNKIRLTIAKWLLPKAQSIRVVSNKIKDSLVYQLKIAREKVTVLPVWIDVVKYQETPIKTDLKKQYPQFTKIVLVASRLTREKNISLVLAAFRRLVDQVPGAGLVIVGSGPEQARLEALVKKLKIQDRVIFVGWSDDLVSYYKTADVFVNASWYEGFGRTIIEALASGCPVVSTDVGIAREVGVVIADFTAEDLSRKIAGVLATESNGWLATTFDFDRGSYLASFQSSFKV